MLCLYIVPSPSEPSVSFFLSFFQSFLDVSDAPNDFLCVKNDCLFDDFSENVVWFWLLLNVLFFIEFLAFTSIRLDGNLYILDFNYFSISLYDGLFFKSKSY